MQSVRVRQWGNAAFRIDCACEEDGAGVTIAVVVEVLSDQLIEDEVLVRQRGLGDVLHACTTRSVST